MSQTIPTPESSDPAGISLRLSAQRALWGNVPASLRAVSVEYRAFTIHCRFVFDTTVADQDRELLSDAATEIIADFPAPYMIDVEFLVLPPPQQMVHLQHLVFLRAEPFA